MASRLPEHLGTQLSGAARAAFTDAMDWASVLCVVVVLIAAAAAMFFKRDLLNEPLREYPH